MNIKRLLIVAFLACVFQAAFCADLPTKGVLNDTDKLKVSYESLGGYTIGDERFCCTKIHWEAIGRHVLVMLPYSAAFDAANAGNLQSAKFWIQNDEYQVDSPEEDKLPDSDYLFFKLLDPGKPFDMYVLHPESLTPQQIFWLCELGLAGEEYKRNWTYRFAYKGDSIIMVLPPQLLKTDFIKSPGYRFFNETDSID